MQSYRSPSSVEGHLYLKEAKELRLLHSEKCISQRQTSSRVWGVKYVLIGETIEKHSKYPTYRKPLSTIGHQDRFQFGEKSDLPMFTMCLEIQINLVP